ncbi:hypothetical protein BMS3Bbin15_00163 [archaeon BMS3Bbin15]|nr:hypothetical protein BMS3Bbin15_00163 [archaeon BMS3Bbin15]HDH02435.1 hypothetical protein [Nitrospirota bacterium]
MGLKYLLQKADLAINGQDWEDVAELAEEILTMDPENEEAVLVKAEPLTHQQRVMESDIFLDSVLEEIYHCIRVAEKWGFRHSDYYFIKV